MKKLRKSNTLKRIFSVLACALVLFGCLSMVTYAEEPVEYELAFGPYNVYQATDTDYSIDFSSTDGYAYIDYKNFTGALRVERRALTSINLEPESYRFDFNVGFGLVTEDYNPRFKVGAFNGSALLNESTISGSVGYTFRTNDTYDVLHIYRSVGLVNSTTRFTLGSDYFVELGDYTTVIGYMEYDYQDDVIILYLYRNSLDSFVEVDRYVCEIYDYNCSFQCFDAILNGSYPSARFMLGPAYYTLFDREYYYNEGYNLGFREGYDEGLEDGIINGRDEGYDEGYNQGYNEGKLDGYREGSESSGGYIDIPLIFDSLFSGTSSILGGFLDWEIFGINVLGVLVSILVVVIVIFIVKKLRS